MEEGRHAGEGDLERVSRQLRAVDLRLLTGRSDLLRSVAGFDRRTSPFASMLSQQERRTRLLQGVMGLDATRRGVLGTAIGASAVTKGLNLDRQRFVHQSTLSLGALASAQLSTPAIQALTRPGFTLPEGVLGDRKKLAAYGGLGNQFHQAIAQGALMKADTVMPIHGFGEAIRKILSGVAAGAWRAVELRHEIDEDAIVFVERHGWPLPLALPRRIVHRVAGMALRGKRDVQRFMRESFGPRTRAYRVSRDRLLESDHFRSRRRPSNRHSGRSTGATTTPQSAHFFPSLRGCSSTSSSPEIRRTLARPTWPLPRCRTSATKLTRSSSSPLRRWSCRERSRALQSVLPQGLRRHGGEPAAQSPRHPPRLRAPLWDTRKRPEASPAARRSRRSARHLRGGTERCHGG